MGRFIALVGLALIIFAIAFMGLLFSPNTVPFVAETMVSVYCEPPENQITSGSRLNTSGTINSSSVYFCEDEEGNRREISDAVATTAAIGFMVFLLIGIVVLLGGLGRMARGANRVQIVRGADGISRVITPASNTVPSAGEASGGDKTLAERLKQLEEARQQGLI